MNEATKKLKAEARRAVRAAHTNALAHANLIGALLDGPCDIEELVKESGLVRSTVNEHILAMRKQRCLRIESYDLDSMGRAQKLVYALGRGPDCKRPARKTGAQRQADYRKHTLERERQKLMELATT